LIAADPEVIVCMPCGYDLARTRAEMYWLAEHDSWTTLRAVRENRVFLADGNQYLNRPGPRVAESLQFLAEVLYPEVFRPMLEGVAWERYGSSRAPDTSTS
jgi:iron complex transport system substrate-binding protein